MRKGSKAGRAGKAGGAGRAGCESGQAVLEFALVVPFVLVLALGVVEVGYGLLDQHIVSKMAREGANLISRDTSLTDSATALATMSSGPVNFGNGNSKVIFSVVKNVATNGTSNYNKPVLYQRYIYGTLAGSSKLNNSGGSFGGAPDFEAANSDNDTSLQITNLPTTMSLGAMLYVTEIYTKHPLLTPLDQFGVTMPPVLYSIAYF